MCGDGTQFELSLIFYQFLLNLIQVEPYLYAKMMMIGFICIKLNNKLNFCSLVVFILTEIKSALLNVLAPRQW
jgi:hypothetical protein